MLKIYFYNEKRNIFSVHISCDILPGAISRYINRPLQIIVTIETNRQRKKLAFTERIQ